MSVMFIATAPQAVDPVGTHAPSRPPRRIVGRHGCAEVHHEPVTGKLRDAFQRAWLFEEVGGTRDDLDAKLRGHDVRGLLVEIDDDLIERADDEQRRSTHLGERRAGQIGTSSAGHDRADSIRPLGGRDECSRGTRAGSEAPDRKTLGVVFGLDPVEGVDETVGEQADVEAQVASPHVDPLLLFGEEVHEEGGQASIL